MNRARVQSLRQRLLNKAKADKRPFQELLQFYAMERYLYRLSISDHSAHFVLKGGLMLRIWDSPVTRPTLDIDFLAYTANELESIKAIFQEVCQINCEDDGLDFNGEQIQVQRIKEDADYEGVRLSFSATLGTAIIRMQIDVGFGDVIYPGQVKETLIPLLDQDAVSLHCYPQESVIAEKLQAMMELGMLNSRMKDFYDIWLLASNFNYEGAVLAKAVSKTLKHRNTDVIIELTAFSEDFIQTKQIQWTAFRNKLKQNEVPTEFKEIIAILKDFIEPILSALFIQKSFSSQWLAKGPWR